jgi:hypothetical protein
LRLGNGNGLIEKHCCAEAKESSRSDGKALIAGKHRQIFQIFLLFPWVTFVSGEPPGLAWT